MSRLTEAEKHRIRRDATDILLSGQGRQFLRRLAAEREAKDGDYRAVKKEIMDIFSEVINDLYTSPPPKMS